MTKISLRMTLRFIKPESQILGNYQISCQFFVKNMKIHIA